jgi:hypothetical protein
MHASFDRAARGGAFRDCTRHAPARGDSGNLWLPNSGGRPWRATGCACRRPAEGESRLRVQRPCWRSSHAEATVAAALQCGVGMRSRPLVRLFVCLVPCGLFGACSSDPASRGFFDMSSDDSGPLDGGSQDDPATPVTGSFVGTFQNDAGMVAVAPESIGPIHVGAPCDTGLAVDGNAVAFARSIGICSTAANDGFGLVRASYENAFGGSAPPSAGQWGLLPAFGDVIKPREGQLLGVLSTGYARAWDDASGTNLGADSDFVAGVPMDGTNYPTGGAPPGYPQAAKGCPQDNLVNDMIDAKLVLKAPSDASGFRFDFDFFSSEWPDYVCSNFNDAFVSYLTSSSTIGNISFDANGNPVAVNMSFLNRCTPGAPVGCLRSNGYGSDPPLYTAICSAGQSELSGTGFGDPAPTGCDASGTANVTATQGASTGWLTTTASIRPGEEFTLELMIWDAGDGWLDSTVLVDHFEWIGGQGQVTIATQPAM